MMIQFPVVDIWFHEKNFKMETEVPERSQPTDFYIGFLLDFFKELQRKSHKINLLDFSSS